MRLCGLRFKKHIFHILYIIVAPLCPAFLKCLDFYKVHRSEKRGVRWLTSYPVHCDWPNTSSVWRKRYAPYHNEVKVTYGQVWWPILGIRALHLTHPKCTHTAVNTHTQQWTHTHSSEHTPGAVGSHLCCGARGADGGSVPCSRAPQSWYWGWRERCTFTPPHLTYNFCWPGTRTRNLWITSPSL